MKTSETKRASPVARRRRLLWTAGSGAFAAAAILGLLAATAPTGAQDGPATGTGGSNGAATAGRGNGATAGADAVRQGRDRERRRGRRGRGGITTVRVNPVIRGEVVETVSVYGRLVARQSGVVAARVHGAVESVKAEVGDRVRKGDVLVTLVQDMMAAERDLKAAELKEIEASIRTAAAQFGLAAQELERLERLRKSAAFSVARYEDKMRDVERFRSALAEKRAKADQARAELRMADLNMKYTRIRAPFDGVISKRHVEVGNYLNVGASVVTMLNDDALEVEAEVPSTRLGGLRTGAAVIVQPETSKPFEAMVRAIVPEENPLARTRTVRFVPRLPAAGAKVAANESVRLQIPAGAPRVATTVSKDAILQRRGQTVVFVVAGDKVRIQQVQIGEAFGARFEVLAGLEPGDRVVVRGNERLRNGQQVRVRGAGGRGAQRGDGGERRRRRANGGDD